MLPLTDSQRRLHDGWTAREVLSFHGLMGIQMQNRVPSNREQPTLTEGYTNMCRQLGPVHFNQKREGFNERQQTEKNGTSITVCWIVAVWIQEVVLYHVIENAL